MEGDSLKHYGVKGMKWGVITKAYTKNRLGDYYTPKQKQAMTKKASKILQKKMNEKRAMGETYENASYRKKNPKTAKEYQQKAKQYYKESDLARKRLESIDSGKLKAGKDFVVNSVYSTNLLLDAVGFINVGRTHEINFK